MYARFPFDTKTPIGYAIAVLFQYTLFIYEFHLLACLVSLAIGSFAFAMAMAEDIKSVLLSVNFCAHGKRNQLQSVLKYCIEFIEVQSSIKQ